MPRQDVPYGGAICRLRERIAEIFDKLGEKLHTINGVPGDGDGNVKIVSGSSAVVISNDPTQNEIAVSLDTSQLPAAAVSSVNGQTGAVALDAGDIPTVGGDVQADLQDLANDISGNTAAINAEVLARQGADSTLQTNINTVSAGIPAAAAAAVAADPTIAYINSELVNKVDLSDVSTVETPDTIAKRNGSGRLVAADPASGATDKTLVTANWVSQSGSGSPNNLVHTNGSEIILDEKVIPIEYPNPRVNLNSIDYLMFKMAYAYNVRIHTIKGAYYDRYASGNFEIRINTDGTGYANFKGISGPDSVVKIYADTNGLPIVALSSSGNNSANIKAEVIYAAGTLINPDPIFDSDTTGLTLVNTYSWTIL